MLTVIFRHLHIGDQLNSIGWTSLFTITTENASRKIDPEKLGIPSAMFVLCGL
jgi:hypothetical protein